MEWKKEGLSTPTITRAVAAAATGAIALSVIATIGIPRARAWSAIARLARA